MGTSSSDSEGIEYLGDPRCPVCKGFGRVHPRLPSGKPDFSRVAPCRCVKEALTRERESQLREYSNLVALARFTFENILPQGRSGNTENQQMFRRAYEAAKSFAAEPKGWLILIGPSGTGKTHLAAAIANERIKYDCPAFFQSVPDLLDHLRSAFAPGSEMSYDELFEKIQKTPLLVLDDLGVQASTPWAREKLDQLLSHRFNSELPTVITTSIPVEELEERLRTRLTDPALSRLVMTEAKATARHEHGWGAGFELLKSKKFSNFDYRRVNLPPEQRENLENAYRVAMDFAESPDGWLVLQGDNGCGKTHLAAAIVNYRYEANQPALFIVVPEFLDHLRSAFSPESKVSYDQLFESVKSAVLLVLDDFGEQSTTPWAQEKLYQVINYRYNALLPTVITTTCELDKMESRVCSRLADVKISTVFNITAPDYRSSQKSSRGAKGGSARPRKSRWE